MRRLAHLTSAAFLIIAPSSAWADEHAAVNALTALNNYIEAVEFSDACLGKDHGRQALEPVRSKIESARKLVGDRYPHVIANGFDTDYVCQRTPGATVDRRRIRREAERLIRELELALGA